MKKLSFFLNCIIKISVLVATMVFGRFLGSEGIMTTPEFLLLLFVLLVSLTLGYRILLAKRKKSLILLFLIYCFLA